MNRKDAEALAAQYARRRLREGLSPADSTRQAAARYGLSTAAELRLIRLLKTQAKEGTS